MLQRMLWCLIFLLLPLIGCNEQPAPEVIESTIRPSSCLGNGRNPCNRTFVQHILGEGIFDGVNVACMLISQDNTPIYVLNYDFYEGMLHNHSNQTVPLQPAMQTMSLFYGTQLDCAQLNHESSCAQTEGCVLKLGPVTDVTGEGAVITFRDERGQCIIERGSYQGPLCPELDFCEEDHGGPQCQDADVSDQFPVDAEPADMGTDMEMCSPMPEVCNGNDDDCDGIVDEGTPAIVSPCSLGMGACERSGLIICRNGQSVCDAIPGEPADETCDGLDNDCDALTDEDIEPIPTQCAAGDCAQTGQRTCQNGRMVDSCEPGEPSPEICNGADDDCDGIVDEGIMPEPTACGVGECTNQGERRCIGGDLVDNCRPLAVSDEVCDGLDNDCDDRTDEDIDSTPTQCGVGVCQSQGQRSCLDGVLVNICMPLAPGVEVCNTLDDDCDGISDEDIDSTPTQCGVGVCQTQGQRSCMGGVLRDSCMPLAPSEEICDGLDNDCDGTIDDVEGGCDGVLRCPPGFNPVPSVGVCIRDLELVIPRDTPVDQLSAVCAADQPGATIATCNVWEAAIGVPLADIVIPNTCDPGPIFQECQGRRQPENTSAWPDGAHAKALIGNFREACTIDGVTHECGGSYNQTRAQFQAQIPGQVCRAVAGNVNVTQVGVRCMHPGL